METLSATNSDMYINSVSSSPSSSSNSRRYGLQFPLLRFFQAPVSTVLEYSGILRPRPNDHETESLVTDRSNAETSNISGAGEVSIRIIGAGEQDRQGADRYEVNDESIGEIGGSIGAELADGGDVGEVEGGDRVSTAQGLVDDDGSGSSNNRDNSYQRYDIQQVARWIEQILPFSLLLLVVFIRQHLQGTAFDLPSLTLLCCCVDLMIYFKN